jgi:membrane protease YdiL (CAAX protease family)
MKRPYQPHIVRNVAIFTLVVYICAWVGMYLDRGHAPGVGSLLFLVSPLAVSLLLRAFAGDGWKDLGINPRLPKNLLWYLASLLMYPIVTLVVVMIDFGLGTITLPVSGFNTGMFLGALTIAVGPMLLKDVFEEVGWRGYLTPKLLKLRYPPLAMHIVTGLIWGGWHLPLIVFTNYTTESLVTFLPRFFVGVVATSLVYGEIRRRTDSVWPAVIMHGIGNALVNTLLLQHFISLNSGPWTSLGVDNLLYALIIAVIGMVLYWHNQKKPVMEQPVMA